MLIYILQKFMFKLFMFNKDLVYVIQINYIKIRLKLIRVYKRYGHVIIV